MNCCCDAFISVFMPIKSIHTRFLFTVILYSILYNLFFCSVVFLSLPFIRLLGFSIRFLLSLVYQKPIGNGMKERSPLFYTFIELQKRFCYHYIYCIVLYCMTIIRYKHIHYKNTTDSLLRLTIPLLLLTQGFYYFKMSISKLLLVRDSNYSCFCYILK